MNLHLDIAFSHLRSRRRQTLVSLLGVVLGVAFFLAVSSLMRGSELDLIERLVDTAPHITIYDEYRDAAPAAGADAVPRRRGGDPRRQAAEPSGAASASTARSCSPSRRSAARRPRRCSPAQAFFSFAGRDEAVTLSGIVPARMKDVSHHRRQDRRRQPRRARREPERHHHRPRAGEEVQPRRWATPCPWSPRPATCAP